MYDQNSRFLVALSDEHAVISFVLVSDALSNRNLNSLALSELLEVNACRFRFRYLEFGDHFDR